MKQITIYGIKNCDTMKKTFQWFQRHGIEYIFHDYKKDGVDRAVLKRAIKESGWDDVINRKGTTWRRLPEKIRETMNAKAALEEALKNPSMIKRPMIVSEHGIYIGFDELLYEEIFVA